MDLKKYVSSYQPVNAQEAIDQENMLHYLDTFDDLLFRTNIFGHFSSSGFITNKTRDKILLIHHNIYKSWGWTGGHMDGDDDFVAVALKEAQEETGINDFSFVTTDIASLDILEVPGHFKNGKYVSAHVHLSLAYLLEADEDDAVFVKEDENSGVAWFPIDKVLDACSEEHMKPVYQKLLDRLKQYDK